MARARKNHTVKNEEKNDSSMSSMTMDRGDRYNQPYSNSPYSLQAMLRFFNNNAGLIFIALSVFLVGFLSGSMWTENNLLKKGLGTTPAAAAAPTTGTAAAGAGTQAGAPEPSPSPLSDADWKEVQAAPAGVIGNQNAKVTMVEFTDYQCPFCSRHFTQTHPQLMTDYVKTGKMRIVFRDQPLPFHPNSRIGALAARCANDQGKFEAMHDALFSKQDEWVNLGKDAAIAKYGEYANTIGMNGNALVDCVKTEKHGKEVDADIALANKVGANGTPTFFINKEILVGAYPFDSFKTLIDKAL